MAKIIKYEGEINLNGIKIPCYVLDDGTRVLSGRNMQEALKMVDIDDSTKQTSGTRLSRYLDQKSLKPFIYKDKEPGHFEPIICYKGESKINGYEATILADICDAFLEARKNIKLSPRLIISIPIKQSIPEIILPTVTRRPLILRSSFKKRSIK